MKMKCIKCDLILASELTELRDLNKLNENDNEDFIQKGHYLVSDGNFFRESKGKIIINKGDLKNCKNHSDFRRLNGCCGLDGMDGMNKICNNGHEIGTECSDCWMPHCVIFETELIKMEK